MRQKIRNVEKLTNLTKALNNGTEPSDQPQGDKYQVNFTMAEFGIAETWPKVDLLSLYSPVRSLVENTDHFCSLKAEVLYFPEIEIPPVAIHPKFYTSNSYFAYENARLLVPNLNIYENQVYFVADPDFFSYKHTNLLITDFFKAPLVCDDLYEQFTELRHKILEIRHGLEGKFERLSAELIQIQREYYTSMAGPERTDQDFYSREVYNKAKSSIEPLKTRLRERQNLERKLIHVKRKFGLCKVPLDTDIERTFRLTPHKITIMEKELLNKLDVKFLEKYDFELPRFYYGK